MAGRLSAALLGFTDLAAALLLAADLAVVGSSVVLRSAFNAPVEWSDDVARGLMVGSSFFGAAGALARGENAGVAFFVDRLRPAWRRPVDAVGAVLVLIVSAFVAVNAVKLGILTTGQTTGSGLPLELTFYPMGAGAACMALFALDQLCRRPLGDVAAGIAIVGLAAGIWSAWSGLSPDTAPGSASLMLAGFALTLAGGLPIGFALALAALIFILVDGALPGVIFAQQMARGIDNFVLLAIPFFILVGCLMEANGMSARLIA
ncbi:MAG: TRAP transporter small permease subunit, partial [Xanthobacteraceae bacterium]